MSSERLRAIRRIALYVLAGLVVYTAALAFCFPYNRVKEMAIAMAAQAGFDVEIGSAGPSFPFGVSFQDIRVRPRLTVPVAKPIQVWMESARIPFLPVIFSGGDAFGVVVHGLGGRIAIAAATHKGGPMHRDLRIEDLNLAQVPGLREMWNLPVTGSLHAVAVLDSKTGRFADASGEIEFKCTACAIGDGKSPVKFGGSNPFLAAGLTLPRVRLGDFAGRVAIEKGLAKAQGIAVKSADAELTLDGDVALRDPLAYSAVNLYVRFKLGDALLKNAGAISSILQVAGAPGLRPDGFYGVRLSGSFAALSAVLSPTSPFGPGLLPGRMGARSPVVPTAAPPPAGPPDVVPPAPGSSSDVAVPPPPAPPVPAGVPESPPASPAPLVTLPAPPPPPPEAESPSPAPEVQPTAVVRGAPGMAGGGLPEGARAAGGRSIAITQAGSLASSGGALGGVGPSSPGGAPPDPPPAGPPSPPGSPLPPGPPSPTRGPQPVQPPPEDNP